ncbi:MAG: hypothetical protein EOM15_13400, partial [Spirochaetia bacterium]|nr:hypothetical protein [Spirochaetia bacterium]
ADIKSKAMVVAANTVKVAFAGIAVAISGLAVLTGKALKEAANFETTSVAFKVLIGDAEKAKKTLTELRTLGAKTPLQFEDITKAAQNLMAFGSAADDVGEQIKMLGDLAMGQSDKLESVVRAYGKVQGKGKASMQELNMITEAGVPILQALADLYDTNTAKIMDMVKKGEIGFSDVDQAFRNMTSSGGQFNGMMDQQSQTLNGMVSTLKDNLSLLMTRLGEAVLPTATKILGDAMEKLDDFLDGDRFDQFLMQLSIFAAQTYVLFSNIGALTKALYEDLKNYIDNLFSPDIGAHIIEYLEYGMNNMLKMFNAPLKLSDVLWNAFGLPSTAKFGMVDFASSLDNKPKSQIGATLAGMTTTMDDVKNAIIASWPKAEDKAKLALSGKSPSPTSPQTAGEEVFGMSLEKAVEEVMRLTMKNRAIAAAEEGSVVRPSQPRPEVVEEPSVLENIWKNSGLGTLLDGPLLKTLTDLSDQFLPVIASISSISALLNPLQTIVSAMLEVLEPVIDSVLGPLVGILRIVGKAFGMLIKPIIEMLIPSINLVADVFIWLYNNVFFYIGNTLITLFNWVFNGIAGIY